MIRALRFAPLCLLLVLPAFAQAAPPTVGEVLEGVQGFYKDSTDLKAGFTQHYTYKVHKRTQKSSGTVFFKKPRRMRWDYRKPVSKVFMADGDTLWVYEPEAAQVFKRSLAQAQLPVALTFMSGEGDLRSEFDASLLPASDEGLRVKLVPKRDQGHYKSLELLVDPQTYQVKASTVVDPVGNINRVVFKDLKTNVGLPDQGFVFKVPDGVRIIEE